MNRSVWLGLLSFIYNYSHFYYSFCNQSVLFAQLKQIMEKQPQSAYERTAKQKRKQDAWCLFMAQIQFSLINKWKKLVTFPLFNSCLYSSRNDPWIVKNCALAKVEIKFLFAYHVITWSMSHVTRWVRYPHPK